MNAYHQYMQLTASQARRQEQRPPGTPSDEGSARVDAQRMRLWSRLTEQEQERASAWLYWHARQAPRIAPAPQT